MGRGPSRTAWAPPLLCCGGVSREAWLQRFTSTDVTASDVHAAHQLTELLYWRIEGAGFNLIGTVQPVTPRCTHYVALHPNRRGVMPTDRVHHLPQQPHLRATPAHTPQPTAPDTATATRPRNARPSSTRESLHPLRRTTPVTSHCTHYVALHPNRRGVMPTDRVHHLPQQPHLRATPAHPPQPTAPDTATATRPRNARPSSTRESLHPIRRTTPITGRYTRTEGV